MRSIDELVAKITQDIRSPVEDDLLSIVVQLAHENRTLTGEVVQLQDRCSRLERLMTRLASPAGGDPT